MPKITTPVLLDPTSFVRPTVVDEFDEFENAATRDDRYAICSFPAYGRRALDAFRILPDRKRSLEDATAFSIACGVPLIQRFEGIERLSKARDVLIHSTSGDAAMVEIWPYRLNPYNTDRLRKLWTRIEQCHARDCAVVAAKVGAPSSSIAGLAICATLMQAENVPSTLRGYMRQELLTFGRELADRASTAALLMSRARLDERRPVATFDGVLAEIRTGQPANHG